MSDGIVDFISISYYSSSVVSANPNNKETIGGNLSMGIKNPYLPMTQWNWQVDAKGLRYTLNELYDRYQLPIMIVENGLGAEDVLNDDETIHDDYRIHFIEEHAKALGEAINIDAVEVMGYTLWSTTDLISMSTGEISKRYGLIYVDVDDLGKGSLKRYRNDSFYFYKSLIETNGDILKK